MVRQLNLSAIMHHLRERGPVSRAALAELTGLNKATVSSLVRQLIDQGFVFEPGESTPGPGRPAVMLRLNPAAGHILAAELAADYVNVIRADFAASVVWRHREFLTADMGQEAVLNRLLALLRSAAEAPPTGAGPLLGVALGVPGLVDLPSGNLLFAPNLGWTDVRLRTWLEDEFHAPIFVDNDTNMAVLGEHYFGAAQGFDNVLYIGVGVGVGSGYLYRGQLHRGIAGLAGETGHMTVVPDGAPCNCGNYGCWETEVSQRALAYQIRAAIARGVPSRLPGEVGPDLAGLTMSTVVAAADAGDPATLAGLAEVGRRLGSGMASLVNVLNPELIVFGGPLSRAGHFLLPILNSELDRRALRWSRQAVHLVLARHGSDACVMGGIATVLEFVLAEPGAGVAHRAAASAPVAQMPSRAAVPPGGLLVTTCSSSRRSFVLSGRR